MLLSPAVGGCCFLWEVLTFGGVCSLVTATTVVTSYQAPMLQKVHCALLQML